MPALPTTQQDWLIYLAAWCGEMAEAILCNAPDDQTTVHTLAEGISATIPVILQRAGIYPQDTYSNGTPVYGQNTTTNYTWLNDPEYPGQPRYMKAVG